MNFMNREDMIRRLVSYSVEAALREQQTYWLQELFEKGFAGYRNYSDSRLRRELELRGLRATDDAYGDDETDEFIADDVPDAISGYAAYGRDAD